MSQIDKSTLGFLKKLAKNNDRNWFTNNKSSYEVAKKNVEDSAQDILSLLSKHDHIETASGKKAIYRIYRDVRFSKDKSPYKKHFAGYFRRATNKLRGGYYFKIEPGASMVGGGFWGPNKEDLKLIRDQISLDDSPLRKVLRSKKFISQFEELRGEKLKTAPKGWDKEHESIDLLNHKQFIIWKPLSDAQVTSPDFAKEINATFKAMRPFFDVMSMYLTTDLNGEDLY
jgi:uncharacterized protein (TIGR02453 family)